MTPAAESGTALSIVAQDLTLTSRQGPIFSGISFELAPGEVLSIAGSAGTGRTSLALVLTGRMKFSHGSLTVAGRTLPRARNWLRRNSVVTPAGDDYGLEEALKVREEVNRARWLSGKRHLRLNHDEILAIAGLTGRDKQLVRELNVLQRRRLDIACAFADTAGLIVVDDLCSGVPLIHHEKVWDLVLEQSAASGATVIATALDPPPASISARCQQHLDLNSGLS